MGNDTGYSVEQAVKEGAVIQEEIQELFVNGKNTVAMREIGEFIGHGAVRCMVYKLAQTGPKRLWLQ